MRGAAVASGGKASAKPASRRKASTGVAAPPCANPDLSCAGARPCAPLPPNYMPRLIEAEAQTMAVRPDQSWQVRNTSGTFPRISLPRGAMERPSGKIPQAGVRVGLFAASSVSLCNLLRASEFATGHHQAPWTGCGSEIRRSWARRGMPASSTRKGVAEAATALAPAHYRARTSFPLDRLTAGMPILTPEWARSRRSSRKRTTAGRSGRSGAARDTRALPNLGAAC
jgi:hypothetical protein